MQQNVEDKLIEINFNEIKMHLVGLSHVYCPSICLQSMSETMKTPGKTGNDIGLRHFDVGI